MSQMYFQVTVNTTHAFITGKDPSGENSLTYLFNWQFGEWYPMEPFPDTVMIDYCGLLDNPDAGLEVAVGNFIYNLEGDNWRQAPELPQRYQLTASAQLEDGIAMLGGVKAGTEYDYVYKFSEDNYQWQLLDEHLAISRERMGTVAVPEDFLNCQ